MKILVRNGLKVGSFRISNQKNSTFLFGISDFLTLWIFEFSADMRGQVISLYDIEQQKSKSVLILVLNLLVNYQ